MIDSQKVLYSQGNIVLSVILHFLEKVLNDNNKDVKIAMDRI